MIDPWTARTAKYHPEIHARLERFLDECARAAGHERKHEEALPQMTKMVKPTDSPKFMESIRRIRDRQKAETDARNRSLVRDLTAGKKTIDGVIKQLGLCSVKSLQDSLRITYSRDGYGEDLDLYIDVRKMINERIKADTKKAKEQKPDTEMIFDGYGFVERARG